MRPASVCGRAAGACGIILGLTALLISACAASEKRETLHIAIPESPHIQDADKNYYVTWLEDRTGLDLEISLIRQDGGPEYLDALFSSDADIDIVMFGEGFSVSEEELSAYVASEDIYVHDGQSYYANTGVSRRSGAGIILWINYGWLKRCGLNIPGNTQELEQVLLAFRDSDPNGNGIRDEIPLAGARDGYACSPVEYILNAYVYNDPYHSRYGINEERDLCYAGTDAFRQGLAYCRSLYEEGLLSDCIWEGDRLLLSELCNSEQDLVGAFTTHSIFDVIYPGNPEILARYIHVPPLAGPDGERNALYTSSEPTVGAVITQSSVKKDAAVRLLDLMMTPEASLIARFGEEGVDWEYADGSDVSVYGGASTVTTVHYLWDIPQNKHLNGIGPMDVPERFLEGVTWNGVNSDSEYINGRAYMSYAEALPEVRDVHPYDPELSGYIDGAMEEFIRGNRDIGSDVAWEEYLAGLSR
ncbi:MAG: hypothetical protein IKO80_07270 [Lachnospiraceae bacterium]|nr:hypothetical protein [Lachnospiraceae bacterium]